MQRHAPPGNAQRSQRSLETAAFRSTSTLSQAEAANGNRNVTLNLQHAHRCEKPLGNRRSAAPHGSCHWKTKRIARPGNVHRLETARRSGSRMLHQRKPDIPKPSLESAARNVIGSESTHVTATFEKCSAAPGPSPQPPADVVPLVRIPPARAAVCLGAFVPPAGHGAWNSPWTPAQRIGPRLHHGYASHAQKRQRL